MRLSDQKRLCDKEAYQITRCCNNVSWLKLVESTRCLYKDEAHFKHWPRNVGLTNQNASQRTHYHDHRSCPRALCYNCLLTSLSLKDYGYTTHRILASRTLHYCSHEKIESIPHASSQETRSGQNVVKQNDTGCRKVCDEPDRLTSLMSLGQCMVWSRFFVNGHKRADILYSFSFDNNDCASALSSTSKTTTISTIMEHNIFHCQLSLLLSSFY